MSYSAASDAAAAAPSLDADPIPASQHPTMKHHFERGPRIFEEKGVTYVADSEEAFRLALLRTLEWKVQIGGPVIEVLYTKYLTMNNLVESCLTTIAKMNTRINELEEKIKTLTAEKNAETA